MDFEDLKARHKIKKPKPLEDMSAADLKHYVAVPQAEIMRVETAIKLKEAMNSLFKTPGQ